jgi:hypothetical protein
LHTAVVLQTSRDLPCLLASPYIRDPIVNLHSCSTWSRGTGRSGSPKQGIIILNIFILIIFRFFNCLDSSCRFLLLLWNIQSSRAIWLACRRPEPRDAGLGSHKCKRFLSCSIAISKVPIIGTFPSSRRTAHIEDVDLPLDQRCKSLSDQTYLR